MANQQRGEIGIKVDGKEYTLRPAFDALCELEQLTGKSFEEMFAEIQTGRMSGLRAAVWCLLQEKHADDIKTLKDASHWIEEAGVDRVLAALTGVVEVNEEPSEEGATANPPEAQTVAAGTGDRLSSPAGTSA